jgi:dTMP kinase
MEITSSIHIGPFEIFHPLKPSVSSIQHYGKHNYPGLLFVVEGIDGAGRTTQINLLKPWLEELGHAVMDTGMTRSRLAGEGIRRAKEGNNLRHVTQSLFHATDFIDRFENDIVPALRAGFIVLTDRYIYSLMARAIIRDMDPTRIRSIYSVALVPDAVFYLRIGINQLLPRVVFSRGFDYWESGMDLYPGLDMYDSFCNYQSALLSEFDQLGEEYKFDTVDASADADTVCAHLKRRILGILEPNPKETVVSNSCSDLIEAFTQRVLENLIPKPNRAEVHAGNGMEIASHQDIAAALRGNGRVAP